MTEDIRRIRREIARLRQGRPRTAVRYPAALRRTITALARDLVLPRWTLTLWLRTPAAPRLRAVAVVPDGAPAPIGPGPVLVMPDGIRVEGASVEVLTTLLRALQ